MTIERYVLAARLLHWLMAAGFLFMWGCGYTMTSLVEEESALEEALYDLHISIGVTLLVLLGLRVVIRAAWAPPEPPATLSPFERRASHVVHLALYWLPGLVILAGWAETNLGGHAVRWFGVAMPQLLPVVGGFMGESLERLSEALHRWLAYTMLAVAGLHVAAALKHRWIDDDEVVLSRMTFGR